MEVPLKLTLTPNLTRGLDQRRRRRQGGHAQRRTEGWLGIEALRRGTETEIVEIETAAGVEPAAGVEVTVEAETATGTATETETETATGTETEPAAGTAAGTGASDARGRGVGATAADTDPATRCPISSNCHRVDQRHPRPSPPPGRCRGCPQGGSLTWAFDQQ
jgi:hypothetical protein